jgi:hypothetical protein
MKRGAKKYFSSLDYYSINKMTYDEATSKAKEYIPVGTRFHSISMGDRDPWYVVKYTTDESVEVDKYGTMSLVIIKSWNKYKKYWIYKVLRIHEFIFGLHLELK